MSTSVNNVSYDIISRAPSNMCVSRAFENRADDTWISAASSSSRTRNNKTRSDLLYWICLIMLRGSAPVKTAILTAIYQTVPDAENVVPIL
eukprot:scaffold212348_cov19-Prasinocladus_malaysianus.AAC.1